MGTIATDRVLPAWADEVRRRYLRGEAWEFILHGNVYDVLLHDGKLVTVSEFLANVLLAPTKDTVILYNLSTGTRFTKRKFGVDGYEDLILSKEPGKVLPLMERALTTEDRVGVILEYAESIVPAADVSLSSTDDRSSVITLHRWSLLRQMEKADSIILLIAENLAELHPKLVSNPRVATVRVPMPSKEERKAIIRHVDPSQSDGDVERLAEVTAGLKSIQIKAILTPAEASSDDVQARSKYLEELLGGGASAKERAEKLAHITQGMSRDEIRKLIAPDGKVAAGQTSDSRAEIDRLVAARKREIIERECFGLIEFVTPQHGFDVVGGMEEVKKDLGLIAKNIREGRTKRVPMGILFTGPMGTGKTFVCEAFAKESGLTTIKLKNFRSKWVGATEGNLERILSVIQAIGQILVIIDEGDRAFGGTSDGDGDGGTSSRVIARIKEFMSDTENRGRVLFILMTNRPDKLDIDIKRAGRLDRKIPFLYPQTADEVILILAAQFRKNKVKIEGGVGDYLVSAAGMVGYSNADIEAIVLLAADYASERGPDVAVGVGDLARATLDYLPSRDVEMIEYMELLAVFEASNRRMLPKKYADLPVDELQARMQLLKIKCGGRR
ncbi:MAG: ATP-binding protein [Myxococcales bacterium]|nr:ATP-binding protein [Myxococcales bacterium]